MPPAGARSENVGPPSDISGSHTNVAPAWRATLARAWAIAGEDPARLHRSGRRVDLPLDARRAGSPLGFLPRPVREVVGRRRILSLRPTR